MNLNTLRKMVASGDMSINALRYLLDCRGECEHLDYKEVLHLDTDYGRASFARDVVGMKNVGGGYLVVGVKDKTWVPVGLADAFSYDTKLLRDVLRKAAGMDLAVDVVKHSVSIVDKQLDFALILVRASAKRSKLRVPSVCQVNFCQREDWGIRQGDIYVRRGDQSVRVSSQEELSELLDDLAEREDLSALEHQLAEPSPFWIESGFYRLLPREYETFIGRSELVDQARHAVESDPRIWIVNLYGPGGVGKSSLASWLAYHYYETQQFRAILQLSAKDRQINPSGIDRLRPTLFSLENLLDTILQLFCFAEYTAESLDQKRSLAITLLSDYSTLLILDNMETVSDGRIMEFVQHLPPETKAKVLLTSRMRSGSWEMPIQVDELNSSEVREFLRIKAREKHIAFPGDFGGVTGRVHAASGGLPLAIEWILGQYNITGNLEESLGRVRSSDSPLLEFSFRNSWRVLNDNAQTALAVLSIFDEPPTLHLWATALGWSAEEVERAAAQLSDATFVTKRVDSKTGQATYQTLPITLAFARNELGKMGDLELTTRTRYQKHVQEMELVAAETERFATLFARYEVQRDTEKKAVILARKAEASAANFDYDEAERLYQLALQEDPRSVYVLVNYGMLKFGEGQVGEAIRLLEEAAQRCTRRTGFLVYFNLGKVYDSIRDREKAAQALRRALDYNSTHVVARHQYGVVLSRIGRVDDAVGVFDALIRDELERATGPTETLLYALRGKIITLRKADRMVEAEQTRIAAHDLVAAWTWLADKAKDLDVPLPGQEGHS